MPSQQLLMGLGALAAAGAAYYMITKDKTPKEMANDAKYAAKRELNNAEDKLKSATQDARDKIGDKIKSH